MMNWFRWPADALAVLTSAKSFRGNAVLGSPTLNRWGLHLARKKLANTFCDFRRGVLGRGVSEAWRAAYRRNGYVIQHDFLDAEWFDALKVDLTRLTQPSVEMAQPQTLTRRFNLDFENCQDLPALRALLTHPPLIRLLRYVAGYPGQPVVAVQCIHADKDGLEGTHDPQTEWHTDTFHSTAKAWLFLHAVAADEGPFAYAPGSHRLTPARQNWELAQSINAADHLNPLHAKGSFRATEAELKLMGYGEPFLGVVDANTLVVADTSGFHRRTPSPKGSIRVEIYLSLRRNPFWAGLYPSVLSLPVIRQRWAGIVWHTNRWMTSRGLPAWHSKAESGLAPDERLRLGMSAEASPQRQSHDTH